MLPRVRFVLLHSRQLRLYLFRFPLSGLLEELLPIGQVRDLRMTSEDILVELAILDSWQHEFPTAEKDVQIAQKLYREQLAIELLMRNKKSADEG